jgi:hypothetical protein
MTDVVLSILALIAGGLILEVFTVSRPSLGSPEDMTLALGHEGFEDFPAGNPS